MDTPEEVPSDHWWEPACRGYTGDASCLDIDKIAKALYDILQPHVSKTVHYSGKDHLQLTTNTRDTRKGV